MTNCDRSSATTSSDRVGRCEISIVFSLLLSTRYLMPFGALGDAAPSELLRVELDDQLLGERHVDLRALRQLVNQDALPLPDHLQPARDRTVARGLPGDLERHAVDRLVLDVDDVVLRHLVAGHVDLHTVDGEVAVADQLAGHPAGPGQAGAVDHVVQPALQDAQQFLAGLAAAAHRFLVVAAELLLHHAVGEAGLLLLLQLQPVFAFLDPRAAVLAGRVGALLECLVTADEVDAQPARLAGGGSGVTSHLFLNLLDPRPGAAWADGNRCAAAG